MRLWKKLLASSLIFVSLSQGGEVDQFLNNLGVSLSSPSAIEAQKRGYAFGGGVTYSAPSATFQPFRVVPPSIRGGCGGIDITFGSFSYLKPEYFIDFAQKTINQAPGFAFDIALDVLCPQCSSIMKKLNALANQINAMSMNSCQLLSNLSNRIKSEVLNKKVASGDEESWLEAVDSTLTGATELMSAFNDYLSNLGCTNPDCFVFAGYASLADRFLNEVPSFWRTANMKYLVRYMFGDVLRLGRSPNYTYICLSPVGNVADIVKLAEKADSVTLKGWNDNGELTEVTFSGGSTIRGWVRKRLDGIITKIINKQPLSASEYEFLSTYDIPALKILNVLAPYPLSLRAVQPHLEKYLAYKLLEEFIVYAYSNYEKIFAKVRNMKWESPDMESKIVECIKTLMNYESNKRADIVDKVIATAERARGDIVEKIKLALTVYELEKTHFARFPDTGSPALTGYMMGKVMK